MIRYFGILGADDYIGIVKIIDRSEAYIYHLKKKKYIRNDNYLNALFDPGTDYEEVTEEEANDILNDLMSDSLSKE